MVAASHESRGRSLGTDEPKNKVSTEVPQRAFVVADAFLIEGRLILVPGFSSDGAVVRIGDGVLLRRPDGSTLTSSIAGFEMITSRPPGPRSISLPISLRGLTKVDVPIGTEVVVTLAVSPATG